MIYLWMVTIYYEISRKMCNFALQMYELFTKYHIRNEKSCN